MLAWLFLASGLVFCTQSRPGEACVKTQTGLASWYGPGLHGRPTASGETFDQEVFSAAHRTLPLSSRVRVTNLENGEEIVVRVNDRGPFAEDRIIDVSRAAARELDFVDEGETQVQLCMLDAAPMFQKER